MSRWMGAVLVGLVLAAAPATAFRNLEVGEQPGDVALPSLDGGAAVTLAGSCGERATLVLFWASWSPRSLEALADLQRLQNTHSPEDLRVLGINVEREDLDAADRAAALGAARDSGASFALAVDPGLELYAAWGVVAVPSAALLDGAGNVLATLDGYPPSGRSRFLREAADLARNGPRQECDTVTAATPAQPAWAALSPRHPATPHR